MANEPFMDRWTLNGTEVLLQDHGRDEANGVPVLDGETKLPTSYLNQNYANWLKVDPRDIYNDNFADWLTKLSGVSSVGDVLTKESILSAITVIRVLPIKHDGLFVMGGTGGLAWSENGTDWSLSNLTVVVYSISYHEQLKIWIAGTAQGIYTSSTGKNWTLSSSSSYTVLNLTYANGIVVASCLQYLLWSEDCTTWNIADSKGRSSVYVKAVYGNGRWISATFDQRVVYSLDGKNWVRSSMTSGAPYCNGARAIVFDPNSNLFVFTGAGLNGVRIFCTPDGISKTSYDLSDGYGFACYFKGRILLGAYRYNSSWMGVKGITVFDPSSGTTTLCTGPLANYYVSSLGVSEDRVIAGTTNNGYWTSKDGINWEQCTGISAADTTVPVTSYLEVGGIELYITEGLQPRAIDHKLFAIGSDGMYTSGSFIWLPPEE